MQTVYVLMMNDTPMRAYTTRALAINGQQHAQREWESANRGSAPVPRFWFLPTPIEA